MLANPWIPTASRSLSRGRHRHAVRPTSSRIFGVLTSVFALITATAVMRVPEPVQPSAAFPIVQAAPSTTQTIPPTSLAPSPSTRPTLGVERSVEREAEYLALSGRPAAAAPEVTPFVTTTVVVQSAFVPESVTVDTVDAVDLAVFAVDLAHVSSRAVASDEALVVQPIPTNPFECHERADEMPLRNENGAWDRNLIAQMTHTLFECVTSVAGFADRSPTSGGWDAARIWGFESLAEQVAAESVVVAYCESQAFAGFALTGNNPWGYGGLFQMGATEMRIYGFGGASKFDPVDNAYAAASYFVAMNRRGAGWGGWGPWAVVNTGYNDEVNDRVKVPVLPRFTSTDLAYRGRRGVELPAWAVDPWSYAVPPFSGCPTTGRRWPAAMPLTES